MLLTITMHANQLVQADQCAVYLHDEHKSQLWSVSSGTGKERRFPSKQGLIGASVQNMTVINVEDVRKDDRFHPDEDMCLGATSMSADVISNGKNHVGGDAAVTGCVTMLVMPLLTGDQRGMGVDASKMQLPSLSQSVSSAPNAIGGVIGEDFIGELGGGAGGRASGGGVGGSSSFGGGGQKQTRCLGAVSYWLLKVLYCHPHIAKVE